MKIFKISIITSFLIISSWVFYLIIFPKITPAKEIIIPSYVGKEVEEVLDSCSLIGLTPNIIYQEDSSEGIVLNTYPREETTVKKDSTINLYVSRKKELTWPLFTGQFYNSIKANIEEFCYNNNISYEVKFIVNNDLPENIIYRQNKEYNTIVVNKDLLLEVVIHDNMIEFPDLVGLDLNEAILILNKYKLNYKCIFEYSLAPFNIILEQSLTPGTKILIGNQTEFTLYVSKGIDFPIGLVGMDIINACILLDMYNVNYEIIYVHSNEKNVILSIDKHLYYDGYIDTIYLFIGY